MSENEMYLQEGVVYDDYDHEEDTDDTSEDIGVEDTSLTNNNEPNELEDEEPDDEANDEELEEEEPDDDDELEEEDSDDDDELEDVVQQTDEVAQMLGKHGIDYNSIVDEFQTNGKLSTETMEKLQKAGYTAGAVKSYIVGQQARYEQYRTKVEKTVGGAKHYNQLAKWAKDNLTKKEKTTYNAAVESGDLAKAKFAVKGLQARYEAREGREAKLVKGKNTVAARVKGFTSLAEYSKATEDPRYNRDKAYTAKVNTRIYAMDFNN